MKKNRELVKQVLLELFSDCNYNEFYIKEGSTEEEVRSQITLEFQKKGIDKSIIDLYVFTSQSGSDVLIKEL